ncbi:hypothetical protein CTRI78_v010941 [Colletotrichum trifolii]|uniref:F-box domain-containing protein n=1 Tax=Colletotrichum trifolii TaxID=5466 RepID=A0A4R8QU99_COLTR|nr:hypothetical protein CTRI78_v010941 [Colletotrichum trifolii]
MTEQSPIVAERPSKRRRFDSMDSNPGSTWPAAAIPVEIFDEITIYLSRPDVKNLRLVNHEFDRMVSAKYFRNVVVPFRSELYKTRKLPVGTDEEEMQPITDALFSSGMRIFQSFGDHILRFALSLELDEETLAYPPVKPTQKAVTSYWGIYRWPHESYLRYTELEGLEQTADETASMKEALRCLVHVQELGLCCDAGLGYISGPDHQLDTPPLPHPVFRRRHQPYTRLQPQSTRHDSDSVNAHKLAFESPGHFKYTVLESMVKNAGYPQDQVRDAISMLLSTENVSLSGIDFDERTAIIVSPPDHVSPNSNATAPAVGPTTGFVALTALETDGEFELNWEDDDDEHESAAARRSMRVAHHEPPTHYPLQPKNLTRAQKEMLLELEWAHRALIQSYVIALIDNACINSFAALTTLTIAKIPSSHIYTLQRHDFWQSLPTLNNVSLAVVADWRQVTKVAPGCVEDLHVSPVDAVVKAHRLLSQYISKQKNVKFLHFEWICGGEFAPGVTQRNMYVLPAPFCRPVHMVQADTAKTQGALLDLPHIQHLSLKNCYSAPHVFLQVIRTMSSQALERLDLETFSLTGAPTREPMVVGPMAQVHLAGEQAHMHNHGQIQFQLQQQTLLQHGPLPPIVQPQAHQHAAILQNLNHPVNPNVPGGGQGTNPVAHVINAGLQVVQAHLSATDPSWNMRLRQPSLLTWPGIIERLAPAPTIRELMAHQEDEEDDETWMDDLVANDEGFGFISRPRSLITDKGRVGIERISFKSCGYVLLDTSLVNNHSIMAFGPTSPESPETIARRRELSPFMQICTDRLAAKISSHMPPQEMFNLTTAYGMDQYWADIYDEDVIEAAKRDGVTRPGRGRFSGTIFQSTN